MRGESARSHSAGIALLSESTLTTLPPNLRPAQQTIYVEALTGGPASAGRNGLFLRRVESGRLFKFYEEGLQGYTYLEQ